MAISGIGAGAPAILPSSSSSFDGNARPAGAIGDSQEQSQLSTGNTGSSESAQVVNQAVQESASTTATAQVSTTQVVTSADEALGTQLGQIVDERA